MKFSKETIELLKNFVTINEGIHFKKGNLLTTAHPQAVTVGQARIQESIPQDFTIYNLNSFLGILSLLGDPELVLKEDKVLIKNESTSISYGFADPSTVAPSPNKEIELKDPDVKFKLSSVQLQQLLKAATVMELGDLKIESSSGKIALTVFDKKDPLSNTYRVELDQVTEDEFVFYVRVENLYLLPCDYEVTIKFGSAILFTSEVPQVKYCIALEKNCSFSKK